MRTNARTGLAGMASLAALLLAMGALPATAAPVVVPCTIVGTAGDDILNGTAGNDVICGLGGDDVIVGRGGDDILRGGPGNDRLIGGLGADTYDGGPGDDTQTDAPGHGLSEEDIGMNWSVTDGLGAIQATYDGGACTKNEKSPAIAPGSPFTGVIFTTKFGFFQSCGHEKSSAHYVVTSQGSKQKLGDVWFVETISGVDYFEFKCFGELTCKGVGREGEILLTMGRK